MAEMARTNADVQLRQRLRQLGGRLITEAFIARWHGNAATVVACGGTEELIEADSLVLATTNVSDTALADGLTGLTQGFQSAGDVIAPRTAVMAIYEGRKIGMRV
jgi:hypothetical protein